MGPLTVPRHSSQIPVVKLIICIGVFIGASLASGCTGAPVTQQAAEPGPSPRPLAPESSSIPSFCVERKVALTRLSDGPDEFLNPAVAMLRSPKPVQGCVTRAILVAGRSSSDEGVRAIHAYTVAEAGRYDEQRSTFRGQNVDYALRTLGWRLEEKRKTAPTERLGNIYEYQVLAELLDPSWIEIRTPPGRIDGADSRRDSIARSAAEALLRYLHGADLAEVEAKILKGRARAAARELLRSLKRGSEQGQSRSPP